MTDPEYFEALRVAVQEGEMQALAIFKMLKSRGLVPEEFSDLIG